ncbi:hypothetical protein GCM10011504_43290 [Siccirubricoccus deserti]|uniref:Methyltransferase domain-containing protein n=1 Tax=Siccirubricoccus deserti TaxID=2013562 RepID=A0A9X0UEG4_9PROT|nr:hypothetical protein [Siccirubricoccus deserti]MBC4017592.1 hypothetical protein [Siccirubricoccus deserti]GGC60368.1 hypothetical protein GCM10011504_43290 [Siccirubricoccus deserti]
MFQALSTALLPQAGRLITGLRNAAPLSAVAARARRFRRALTAAAADAPQLADLPHPLPAPEGAPEAESLALARTDWAERLWDAGFTGPGGAAEALRLSGLLPLSPATTLLLLGQDAGGAAAAIATQRGAWIASHQHDPVAAARMAARLRPFGRRIEVRPWSPQQPAFRKGFHQHALALEPLRPDPRPGPLCAAIAGGLKPGGQFVLLELVEGASAGQRQAALRRWMQLETRSAPPPSRAAVEAALHAAGFQVHVTEDASQRHCSGIVEAFGRLMPGLRAAGRPASPGATAALLAEVESWLLRHRLVASGQLTLLRWHASRRR